MWNLYIEVIAIVIVITISLTLLAICIAYNIHIIQLCRATSIKVTYYQNSRILIVSSEPEYIGVILYNVCYVNDRLTYNYTMITTPTALVFESKKCVLILVASGSITLFPECKKSSSITNIYVSPCGTSSSTTNCYPWAEIAIGYVNGRICGYIEKTSIELAKKWCSGLPELYIWSGGLIKGVVR